MMVQSQSYRMRLEPALKEALEATLPEKKRGGRAGGLSLLFRRLAYLYLKEPLPAQRWREDLAIPEPEPEDEDLAELTLDDIEAALVDFEQQKSLSSQDLEKAARILEFSLEPMVHALSRADVSFDQHRGFNLIGRFRILLFNYEN